MQILAAPFQFIILLVIFASSICASEDPIVTHKIEGNIQEVSNNVRAAIIGKGINITHVLPASQMLHRTESAFSYDSGVYVDAEIYEYCSARISHMLSRAHPDNIILCPFTISASIPSRTNPAWFGSPTAYQTAGRAQKKSSRRWLS